MTETYSRATRRRFAPISSICNNKGLTVGLIVFLLIALLALFAPLISPHDPYSGSLSQRLIGPIWTESGTWAHPLGTDTQGRDYLSRLLYGARVSLSVGILATVLACVIGSALGIVAGYFGGKVDAAIMFIVTVRVSMPVILISLAVLAASGASFVVVVVTLGCLLWDRFAIVLRSATQQIRSNEFVVAARSMGCSPAYILVREVLPNVLSPLVVIASLEIAHAILVESTLSFLGLGVPPPVPSWGLMISEGRALLFAHPWLVTIPGIAIMVLVLAVNMMGDGVRRLTAPSEER